MNAVTLFYNQLSTSKSLANICEGIGKKLIVLTRREMCSPHFKIKLFKFNLKILIIAYRSQHLCNIARSFSPFLLLLDPVFERPWEYSSFLMAGQSVG